jgi:FKBP-type peptidyl-prolyl cis-trans isomerase FkpA
MLRLSRFALVLLLCAATAACGGGNNDTPTSPSANVPFATVDITVGTGAEATAGRQATVAYAGWLYSATASQNKGTQFDAGVFTFTVGTGVIQGFSRGVTGMRVGGQRRVVIPPDLGYGSAGAPPAIPGNATLVFDIELRSVQ